MSSSFDLSSLAELANRFREISPGEVTETLTGEFTTTREGVSGEAGGLAPPSLSVRKRKLQSLRVLSGRIRCAVELLDPRANSAPKA